MLSGCQPTATFSISYGRSTGTAKLRAGIPDRRRRLFVRHFVNSPPHLSENFGSGSSSVPALPILRMIPVGEQCHAKYRADRSCIASAIAIQPGTLEFTGCAEFDAGCRGQGIVVAPRMIYRRYRIQSPTMARSSYLTGENYSSGADFSQFIPACRIPVGPIPSPHRPMSDGSTRTGPKSPGPKSAI